MAISFSSQKTRRRKTLGYKIWFLLKVVGTDGVPCFSKWTESMLSKVLSNVNIISTCRRVSQYLIIFSCTQPCQVNTEKYTASSKTWFAKQRIKKIQRYSVFSSCVHLYAREKWCDEQFSLFNFLQNKRKSIVLT